MIPAAAPRRHFFTIHYSLFSCLQGVDLPSCPICAPHFFFSLQEKKKRAAPGAKEKEGLRVQTKMDPCFYKIVLHYVASMAEIWCKPECPLLLFPLPLAWRL